MAYGRRVDLEMDNQLVDDRRRHTESMTRRRAGVRIRAPLVSAPILGGSAAFLYHSFACLRPQRLASELLSVIRDVQ
jgi:hypothetical protein